MAAWAARNAWRRRKRSGTTRRCRCCWPPTPPGRRSDANTVTVTKNEVLYSLNKPDDFILALVLFGSGGDDTPRVRYVRRPFQREPDFRAASVNYALKDLLVSAENPR